MEETEHLSKAKIQDFADEKIRLQTEEIRHIEKCAECAQIFFSVMQEAARRPPL